MLIFIQKLVSQIQKKEIQTIPEVLAFNFMMALIPLLIIFFQILAFLSIETTVFDETIARYLPSEIYTFIRGFLNTAYVDFNDTPILIAVTIITLSLTISKGVNGIFKAFLITYREIASVAGYKHRIRATLTFFLLLGFSTFATAFVTTSHLILASLPPLLMVITRTIILLLTCFTFFFLLFKLAPNKKKATKQLLPGCLITTFGFIIATMVFTYYVDRLANFHLIYGSLAIIIILLTWLYLVGWVINLGIQVNYVMQQNKNE